VNRAASTWRNAPMCRGKAPSPTITWHFDAGIGSMFQERNKSYSYPVHRDTAPRAHPSQPIRLDRARLQLAKGRRRRRARHRWRDSRRQRGRASHLAPSFEPIDPMRGPWAPSSRSHRTARRHRPDALQRNRPGTELRKPQSHRTNRTCDSRGFAAGPLHFAARSSRTLRSTPETGANEGSDGCRVHRATTAVDTLTEGWRLPQVNAVAECNG
jgi:hypothetical protein